MTAALSVGAAAPALSQVHVQVLGGGTKVAETDVFIGGALGGRAGVLEIGVEAGRIRNALPRGLVDLLNELQEEFTPGQNVQVSLPATYVKGSLRFMGPTGPVKPFLGVGAGIARVQPRVEVTTGNPVLDEILSRDIFRADNNPLATIEAGIRFDLPKVLIDVGYRYWGIFDNYRLLADVSSLGEEVIVSVNSAFVAVGVKF